MRAEHINTFNTTQHRYQAHYILGVYYTAIDGTIGYNNKSYDLKRYKKELQKPDKGIIPIQKNPWHYKLRIIP